MRILFALRSLYNLHYFQRTIWKLCARGHTVHLVTEPAKIENIQNGLSVPLLSSPAFRISEILERKDVWERPLHYSRELLNFARYLNFAEQSVYYGNRWAAYYLPETLRLAVAVRPIRSLLRRPVIQKVFQSTEHLAPPAREVVCQLKEEGPDVVVASPANATRSTEIEYLKAAQELGIPTVVPVVSWDNLTTKGIFHIVPETMLVWNMTQLREAVDYHGIPEEKIVITGAPVFDPWFENTQPSMDRTSFCANLGIDAEYPVVTYLGSSSNIARDESWIVAELARRLRNDRDSTISKTTVLVRPHPANAEIYRKLSEPNVIVWPQRGELPQTHDTFRNFHNTLCHSACSVGLNTSGMIDAVIANRPCIALCVPQYDLTQSKALHLKHLLEAGVFEIANGLDRCIELMRELDEGRDARTVNRLKFVEDFIRPRGLEKPASELAARAIEFVASGHNASSIDSALSAL